MHVDSPSDSTKPNRMECSAPTVHKSDYIFKRFMQNTSFSSNWKFAAFKRLTLAVLQRNDGHLPSRKKFEEDYATEMNSFDICRQAFLLLHFFGNMNIWILIKSTSKACFQVDRGSSTRRATWAAGNTPLFTSNLNIFEFQLCICLLRLHATSNPLNSPMTNILFFVISIDNHPMEINRSEKNQCVARKCQLQHFRISTMTLSIVQWIFPVLLCDSFSKTINSMWISSHKCSDDDYEKV